MIDHFPAYYLSMKTEIFDNSVLFQPEENQVIYVENTYHEEINDFIRNHYEEICNNFKNIGYEFCYLPFIFDKIISEEIVRYYTPYRNEDGKTRFTYDYINRLCEYPPQRPALIIHGYKHVRIMEEFGFPIGIGEIPFDMYYMDGYVQNLGAFFDDFVEFLIKEKEEKNAVLTNGGMNCTRTDVVECNKEDSKKNGTLYEIRRCATEFLDIELNSNADNNFPEEVEKLMKEVSEKIEKLRQYGINEMFLNKLLCPKIVLSTLYITSDGKIYLPEYKNLEIKMTPLVKAVYFLFLRHPEGIMFKTLPDYRDELMLIYKKLTGRISEEDILRSIEDVTNPCKNSINEKCARIREAFIREFDDRLAEYYYITGDRATPKGIILSRNKVIWDWKL